MNINDLSIDQLEQLIKEKKEKQKNVPSIKIPWESPVGMWKVITEGDCEGKSVKDLGIHKGHVSDIAHKLSGYSMYKLHFSPINIEKENIEECKINSTHIQLDISSNTWTGSVTSEERQKMVQEFLEREKSEVNFCVKESHYYSSTQLIFSTENS